jgi:hypothetical protein
MALGAAPVEFQVALEPEPPRISESLTVTPTPNAGAGALPRHDLTTDRAARSAPLASPWALTTRRVRQVILVLGAVVELGHAGGLVVGDLLGLAHFPTIEEVAQVYSRRSNHLTVSASVSCRGRGA